MARYFTTGTAGFIGSHLVDRLVTDGHAVTVYDNLSSGRPENIKQHWDAGRIRFVRQDVLNMGALGCAMRGHEIVVHCAAHTDNLFNPDKTRVDLEQGIVATWNILECMRATGIKKIVFASSASVYADCSGEPKRETDLAQLPQSLYAASKWSAEALISAYCSWFGIDAWVYRFGNVVANRLRHGVHWALLERLKERPASLKVLGDGGSERPFIHVGDLVDGILFGIEHEKRGGYHVWNLASPDTTTVATVARHCIEASPYPDTPIAYTGGEVGWIGDVRCVKLDTSKLAALGWRTRYTSDEASELAARELAREIFS